jgi:hypothetical protein
MKRPKRVLASNAALLLVVKVPVAGPVRPVPGPAQGTTSGVAGRVRGHPLRRVFSVSRRVGGRPGFRHFLGPVQAAPRRRHGRAPAGPAWGEARAWERA